MYKMLLAVTVLGVSSLGAADWSGRWIGTMETNGSSVKLFVTLDEHLSSKGLRSMGGTIATGNDAKTVGIEDAEVNGDQLTFAVHDNAGRLVRFRLSMKDGALGGEAEVDGVRSKVSVANPSRVQTGLGFGDRTPKGSGSPAEPGPDTYRLGNGVTAPVLLSKRDPEYSEEARAAKYQGTVLLAVEVGPNGKASSIRVMRGLGLGLNEKAIEAVDQWRFKPGQKDGKPVTVLCTIEVNFRL
jgi:TonB family protein